jgi:hypothetical protein
MEQEIMEAETLNQTSRREYIPRFAFVCEPQGSTFSSAKRVIAIAFTYNKDGEVAYGSSIFKCETARDVFGKKTSHSIAEGRFRTCPVSFKMTTEKDKFPDFKKVVESIRKNYVHAVVSEKNELVLLTKAMLLLHPQL